MQLFDAEFSNGMNERQMRIPVRNSCFPRLTRSFLFALRKDIFFRKQ